MVGVWPFGARWTMAPLRCAAIFDPFLSLDCASLHPGAIQGKEGIKLCYLATLEGSEARSFYGSVKMAFKASIYIDEIYSLYVVW